MRGQENEKKTCSNRRGLLFGLAASAVFAAPHAHGQEWLEHGLNVLRDAAVGGPPSGPTGAALSQREIGAGLREALTVAADAVVSHLGRPDGFLDDPVAYIPLPRAMKKAKQALELLGGASVLDELEYRMNRAAEQATPHARALFHDAINQMSFDDARRILTGPNDSATRYFERRMTPGLRRRFAPIVGGSLQDVGALRLYDEAVSGLPPGLAPNARASLTDYVLDETLEGLFHYLAEEERAIRQHPFRRTSDLLKKVFAR